MANPGDELVFAPLGGVGEIGMNLSIYGFGPERRRTWLAVVIGIGVNCAHHPAVTGYPATNLAAAGALVAPESLAQALIAAMARRLAEWNRGENFAAIRAAWLRRAAGLGAPARVRLPEREVDGIAETLDEAGRLVLRLADGSRERIAAGEMFPLPAPASA